MTQFKCKCSYFKRAPIHSFLAVFTRVIHLRRVARPHPVPCVNRTRAIRRVRDESSCRTDRSQRQMAEKNGRDSGHMALRLRDVPPHSAFDSTRRLRVQFRISFTVMTDFIDIFKEGCSLLPILTWILADFDMTSPLGTLRH